jgi:hypothetical protein
LGGVGDGCDEADFWWVLLGCVVLGEGLEGVVPDSYGS